MMTAAAREECRRPRHVDCHDIVDATYDAFRLA
jgi:hypothetical protein